MASKSTWPGSLTDNLSVIASYGYTDAKVTDDPGLQRQTAAERAGNTPVVRCS